MSGIAGIAGFSDESILNRMLDVIKHRGPDDKGTFSDENCIIGSMRLSIIDLKYGHQPMHNEEGTIFTVLGGEIYNFRALRAELEKNGHEFYSDCDTEVLVHLYEEYGEKMLAKIDGIYAFCIWDSEKKRMFLARDPLGVKPLHYSLIGDNLLFGSEIKSLLQYDDMVPKANKFSIWAFLNQGYIPTDQTMFEGIKRLMAGHYLIWDEKTKSPELNRYWNLKLLNGIGNTDYYIKNVRSLFEKAVEKRLNADVPIGFLLSGGSDSLSIVAMTRYLKPEEKFATFTMEFPGDRNNLNEVKNARSMAEKYSMDHHECVCDYEDISFYDMAIWHNEEPRFNILYNYIISEFAKKYVKVVVAGVGGDELFAGYDRNRLAWKLRHVPKLLPTWTGKRIPYENEFKRRLRQLASTSKDRKLFFINFMPTGPLRGSELDMWTTDRTHPSEFYRDFIDENGKMVDAYLKAQLLTYLPQGLLHVMDRETMAFGLEGRVPFCDVALTEFAFKIPYKLKVKSYKHILSLAMADLVPKETYVKKGGAFGGEIKYWFDGGLKDIANQRLKEVTAPFVSQEWVNRLLSAKDKTPRQYEHLWNLLAYESWYRMYLLGEKLGS